MTTQQVIQLLIVLLIVGSSFFGWLFKQVQEQRERKRIRDEQERRRDEMLRTGRDVYAGPAGPQTVPTEVAMPPSADPQTRRREELARRRREQIEELRRRAAARQAGQRPGPQPTSPVPARAQVPSQPGPAAGGPPQDLVIQLPGGRVLRIPAPQQPQGSQPQPQPRPQPQRPKRQPQPRPQSKSQPKPQPVALDPAYSGESTTEARLGKPLSVQQTPEEVYAIPSGVARPIPVLEKPMTPADWRRAIVMREILDRPLALRDPARMTDPLT